MVCHGNATYKRLNTKIIEDIEFQDRQLNRLYVVRKYIKEDNVGVKLEGKK